MGSVLILKRSKKYLTGQNQEIWRIFKDFWDLRISINNLLADTYLLYYY